MKCINRVAILLAGILCAANLAFAGNTIAPQTLSFGIVPQQAASKLARLWSPIFRTIKDHSGHTLVFKTAPNIPVFEQRLAAGDYDLAYMNPYHYTVFHQAPGYIAFAKQKDKRIRGIVVVRKDGPITDLTEVNGQTLAFPAPAAFAASILPRGYMQQQGIVITPKYVSSHDSVYRNVALGLFPAGGGVMRTFGNTAPEIQEQLRVLWTTPAYTPHAFAAHPRVSTEVVAEIAEAFFSMDQNSQGLALLKSINFTGIEPATNDDWDDVRALELDLLDSLIDTPADSATQ